MYRESLNNLTGLAHAHLFQLVEDEILVCVSSIESDTRYIDSNWMTEEYDAVSCQFYGCIFFDSFDTGRQYMNVLPVTCSTLGESSL